MWTGDTTEVPALAGLQHALVQQGGGKILTPGNRRDVVDDSGSEGDVATAALS